MALPNPARRFIYEPRAGFGKRSTKSEKGVVVRATLALGRGRGRPALIALFLALVTAGLMVVGARPAFAGTDDYPSPWRAPTAPDSMVDTWGYYNRECTSFVAWRLHSRNGFEMPHAIGDASAWASWASSHGYTVNTTPAVGSVAYWVGGDHVAWVEAVHSSTSIDIEEYNVNGDHSYHEELNLSTSGLEFIHFRDIIPVQLPGQPVVVTNPDGSLSAFARGNDGNLWATWQYGYDTNWYPWANLGGSNLTGQPVVVTNPDGSLSTFARGSDGNLYATWQFGYQTNWHSMVSLGGGNLTGTPVIKQDAKNGGAQSAFMIGSNGALYNSWQSSYGSTWHSWVSLGGSNLTGQPVVVTNPDGSLSAFARGSDGNLYATWQYGYDTTWNALTSLGGGNLASNPVIMQDAKNGDAQSAFLIGSDGRVYTSWQTSYGSTWSAWAPL